MREKVGRDKMRKKLAETSLFLSKIHRTDAKSKSSPLYVAETILLKYALHHLTLGESLHSGRKVRIGPFVPAHEPAHEWHDDVRVEPKELAHGEVRW